MANEDAFFLLKAEIWDSISMSEKNERNEKIWNRTVRSAKLTV